MSKSDFLVKFIELMRSKKITSAALSKATGLSEITINKIRNGQNTNPTIGTLILIARYFNVSVDDLLGNDTTNNPIKIFNIDADIDVDNSEFNWSKYFPHIKYAIKISNNNYLDYKKGSILLISDLGEEVNEEIGLLEIDSRAVICKIILEGNLYIGKSLLIPDKYYEIKSKEEIKGVVVGVIWKKS